MPYDVMDSDEARIEVQKSFKLSPCGKTREFDLPLGTDLYDPAVMQSQRKPL